MFLRTYTKTQVGLANLRVRLHDHLQQWVGSERGSVAAEYALLVALIAVVIIVGAFALGTQINAKLSQTANCISTANGAPC